MRPATWSYVRRTASVVSRPARLSDIVAALVADLLQRTGHLPLIPRPAISGESKSVGTTVSQTDVWSSLNTGSLTEQVNGAVSRTPNVPTTESAARIS